jgi:rSAM/selenodomain-associated transferase 1
MPLETFEEGLILFARSRVPGEVKTRLQPDLSPEEAALLHRALVRDAVALLEESARQAPRRLEIRWTSALSRGDELSAALQGWAVELQQGDDLGERLIHAFQEGLHRGAQRLVAIGADSPTMGPEYLEAAFQGLRGHEMVVGPAQDGGYVLVGCSRLRIRPFQNIPWGTDRVMAETRKRLKRLGISHALLDPGHDLDTLDDLRRTYGELQHLEALGVRWGAHTLACIRKLAAVHAEWRLH